MKNYILFVLAATLTLSGCVTTKKKGETSKLGKLWHNMNSRYNAHFNAEVLMDETLLAVEQGHQDVYSEVLPLYKYIEVDDPERFNEPMDQAIEKAAIAISIHRPSHWTDDHYLLMAKAQFIKQDYESAEATLRYLIKHYDPDNLVKATASTSKARNAAERKLQAKERSKEKKIAAKEREKKIKDRRKEIQKSRKKNARKSKKEIEKQRQARAKEREQQIKDRSELAKSKGNEASSQKAKTEDLVKGKLPRKKKQEPFAAEPDLPKVKDKQDNYFMKHKPAHQEAQLWLAKTLIERDRFGEAATILRNLDRGESTFPEIREEVYVVRAYSALRRGLEEEAIEPLQKGVEMVENREQQARLAFILAQIQEQSKHYAAAGTSYDAVVDLKPSYEMAFNAELNKMVMLLNAGKLVGPSFEKDLLRMIRDDKNREYRDQLYYALGRKDQKTGNIASALINYSKSVQASEGNKVQLSESYYAMAAIHYDMENYIDAKYYFDSTATSMSKSDQRFEKVAMYSKNLTQIAANLEEIELQDSLIRLAALSEKELQKLASAIIKKQRREKAIEEANSLSKQPGRATLSQTSQLASASAPESSFFAYNEKLLKRGQRDFDRDWRGVQLEDDWRRSNKNSISLGGDSSDDGGDQGEAVSQTEVEEIFADVPRNEEELAAARKKIEDALFKLGQLFRSELENSANSIESLEQLLVRFPGTEHELDAYYLLLVAHKEMGATAQAKKYQNLILTKHPDSDYANYIRNPYLLQNIESEEQKLESFYKGVYSMYEQGQVKAAFDELDRGKNQFGTKHKLQSKFAFLTALCVGKLKGREPYINELKELIAKYPKTEEEKEAKEIIRLLGVRIADLGQGAQEINPDAHFKVEANDHLHLVLVPMRSTKNLNQGRVSIAEYNTKYHKLDQLSIGTIVLDDGIKKVPTYVVRRFDSREKAMAYYDGVQKNIADFIPGSTSFEIFIATQRNYRKVVQLKSIDLYREFFVREYLSK